MKNLIYSLCLLIGSSSIAQSINYQATELNLSNKIVNSTTESISNLLLTIDEATVEEVDEAFDFDTTLYLPTNFNAYVGLFDAFDLASEAEDEAFDFDTTAYLPVGFNANLAFEFSNEVVVQADEQLDFDTHAYLPIGFNANIVVDNDATYIASNTEEDQAFDFNTTAYLPIGFNANNTLYDTIIEIAIEDTDESFEFDTLAYLPENFEAHESSLAISTVYYFDCIAFPSS